MSTVAQDTDLFPGENYEVPFPKVDGKRVDELKLTFGGGLMLNRNNPEHTRFMEALTLGSTLELTVLASVDGKAQSLKVAEDGAETTTLTVRLGVGAVSELDQ